jgi:hypothetical protein
MVLVCCTACQLQPENRLVIYMTIQFHLVPLPATLPPVHMQISTTLHEAFFFQEESLNELTFK